MATPPFPPSNPHPPPPPHPSLSSTLAHLRSLLSASASALAALPSPLFPAPTPLAATATISFPMPTTTLPPPASAVTLPIPLAPAPYADCPAIVRTTPTPVPDSCSLPAFLAAECADFSSSSSSDTTVPDPSQKPRLSRILPSELALLRRELDSWGTGATATHPPSSYSYTAARVVDTFHCGATPRWEAELRRWVLASSPRYGVSIDVAVRDHVWSLVWLCLKAASTEARCSLHWIGKGDDHMGLSFDPRALKFECPRLAEGVLWLGAQLGVLYGEGNGRLFAVAAVKLAVLSMGCCLIGGAEDGFGDGRNGQDPVSISQVAAAIIVLYRRFTMEEKIKALQAPHPSKYQLLSEYSKALEQGHLERSTRPHYRAVMEYDGILSRGVDNHESGRAKTREELLAEERDYKRRRQSYRGKKVKRNPAEILRDIIDEHMEEIKQAGGIGCLVGAPDKIAQNLPKSNSHGGTHQGSFEPRNSSYDKSTLGFKSPSCENSPHADSMGTVSSRIHDKRDYYKNLRYEVHGNRYQDLSDYDNRWIKESENEICQSYPNNRENKGHRRNSNDHRKYAYKHKNDVSEDSNYRFSSSDRSSDRSRSSRKRHRSVSVTQEQFDDRYDPQSTYSDKRPPSTLDDITEGKHVVYHDEEPRHGS